MKEGLRTDPGPQALRTNSHWSHWEFFLHSRSKYQTKSGILYKENIWGALKPGVCHQKEKCQNPGLFVEGLRKCIPQSDTEVKWKHMEISLHYVWKQECILSSQLESVGSLRSTDPLLVHCHRAEFLHFINSGPFSNGFASKITQQLTSIWEYPAVHSPVQAGVLASWRQAV